MSGRLAHLFVRNFIYKTIYDQTKPFKPSNDLTNREKAAIASFSGALAAIVSNPFELIYVR